MQAGKYRPDKYFKVYQLLECIIFVYKHIVCQQGYFFKIVASNHSPFVSDIRQLRPWQVSSHVIFNQFSAVIELIELFPETSTALILHRSL